MEALSLDLIRVTEASAIAAAAWAGRGDKESADKAATDSMRNSLSKIKIQGKVVIGEGEKDNAPMLFCGESVGCGGDYYEIAVDPVDCTTRLSLGQGGAISAIAFANKLQSIPDHYMNKIAYGSHIAEKTKIPIGLPLQEKITRIQEATGKGVGDIVVCMLDRPRHKDMLGELRNMGCRICLIQDGDIMSVLKTCLPEPCFDVYLGIGGCAEGLIGACIAKATNGHFECQLNSGEVYTLDQMVQGECCFLATGITSDLLTGVKKTQMGWKTNSVVISPQLITFIESEKYEGKI